MKKLILILFIFASSLAKAQPSVMYHMMLRSNTPAPSTSFQSETIQFMDSIIAQAGVTWDSTMYYAVDTLVRDGKGLTNPRYATSDWWTGFSGGQILPFVGGVAASHAFNLVNPTTYKATFSGSPTHSSAGVALNGTSQFINTNYSTALLSYTNAMLSEYYHLPTSAAGYLFGRYDGSTGVIGVSVDYDSVLVVLGLWGGFSTSGLGNILRKFNALDYSSASRVDIYSNGVSKYNEAPVNGVNNGNIFIGCLNLSGGYFFGKQQTCKFWGVRPSMLSSQHVDYSRAVTEFEIRMGRN